MPCFQTMLSLLHWLDSHSVNLAPCPHDELSSSVVRKIHLPLLYPGTLSNEKSITRHHSATVPPGALCSLSPSLNHYTARKISVHFMITRNCSSQEVKEVVQGHIASTRNVKVQTSPSPIDMSTVTPKHIVWCFIATPPAAPGIYSPGSNHYWVVWRGLEISEHSDR